MCHVYHRRVCRKLYTKYDEAMYLPGDICSTDKSIYHHGNILILFADIKRDNCIFWSHDNVTIYKGEFTHRRESKKRVTF